MGNTSEFDDGIDVLFQNRFWEKCFFVRKQYDSKLTVKGWGLKHGKVLTYAEMLECRKTTGAKNYGIILPEGYIVLDFESHTAFFKARKDRLISGDQLVMKTRQGFHVYLKYEGTHPYASKKINTALEIQSPGAVLTWHGSVVDGQEYQIRTADGQNSRAARCYHITDEKLANFCGVNAKFKKNRDPFNKTTSIPVGVHQMKGYADLLLQRLHAASKGSRFNTAQRIVPILGSMSETVPHLLNRAYQATSHWDDQDKVSRLLRDTFEHGAEHFDPPAFSFARAGLNQEEIDKLTGMIAKYQAEDRIPTKRHVHGFRAHQYVKVLQEILKQGKGEFRMGYRRIIMIGGCASMTTAGFIYNQLAQDFHMTKRGEIQIGAKVLPKHSKSGKIRIEVFQEQYRTESEFSILIKPGVERFEPTGDVSAQHRISAYNPTESRIRTKQDIDSASTVAIYREYASCNPLAIIMNKDSSRYSVLQE